MKFKYIKIVFTLVLFYLPVLEAASVERLFDGLYTVRHASSRYDPGEYAFWVDIKLKPEEAQKKEVKVIWSEDNWETTGVAHAHFEEILGDGSEKWGVDVKISSLYNRIEYAIAASIDGLELFDPGNNHRLGYYLDDKVKLLKSDVVQDDEQYYLVGEVNVLNLGYEKEIEVHFTRDQWQTEEQVYAEYIAGNNWKFKIPLTHPTPQEMELVIAYRVNGETYWDNNGGKNHNFKIGPDPEFKYGNYLTGFEYIGFSDSNFNKAQNILVTLGGVEIYRNDQTKKLFFTELVDMREFAGASQLKLRIDVTDVHGFQTSREWDITTDQNVKSEGSFYSDSFKWVEHVEAEGDFLYVIDNDSRTLHKFNTQDSSEQKTGTINRPNDLTILPTGQVLTLEDYEGRHWLRWYSADLEWQGEKIIKLAGEVPYNLDSSEEFIFVGSYPQNIIYRLNKSGEIIDKWSAKFQQFTVHGNSIWTITHYPTSQIEQYSFDGKKLKTLDLTVFKDWKQRGNLFYEDLAVTDDFIAILHSDQISFLDLDGRFLYHWSARSLDHYNSEQTFRPDGMFGSVVSSIAVSGNKVFVGDVGFEKVHVFSLPNEN